MTYACLQTLAGEIRAAGGIVTAQDLLSAQPVVKQPITAQVHVVNPYYISYTY
jgi:gamma-glutamyltranspeptidase